MAPQKSCGLTSGLLKSSQLGARPVKTLEFNGFRLLPGRRELLHLGRPFPIQAKLFDALVVLAENHERVVEKQELLDVVWSGVCIEESALFQTISALRKALGNGQSDGVRYIATIPGRGYRFVAPLKITDDLSADGRMAPSSEDPAGGAADPTGANFSWGYGAMGLTAALLLASGLAAGLWLRSPASDSSQPLRRFSIALDHAVGEAAISPNGRYVAYTRCRSAIHGLGTLWLRDLQTGETTKLVDEPAVRHIFWSPTSEFVGYAASSGGSKSLERVSVAGGAPMKICDIAKPFTGAAWSRDGESIVISTLKPGALSIVPSRGGLPSLLLEASGDLDIGMFHPTWLPGPGRESSIAYSQGRAEGDDPHGLELMLYRPDSGGEPVRLGPGFAPAYSPTGHILFYRASGGLSALPFSFASMKPLGDPFPIAEVRGLQGPSVSQDGSLVYVRIDRRGLEQLVWRDRAGRPTERVGRAQFYVAKPELSPDGRKAATVGGDGWGESIWIQDLNRPEASRLTFSKSYDFSPVWSPDGTEVLFRSDRSGNGDIYIRPADGTGEARKFLATSGSEQPEDWSSDGRWIIFTRGRPGGSGDLFYVERTIDGQWSEPQAFLATDARETAAQLSPDGRFVAYVSDESGRSEVYVRVFPEGEGKWQISEQGGTQPRWSPRGDEIFYVEDDGLKAVPIRTSPSFSKEDAAVLFSGPGLEDIYASPLYDVSADGRRFLMADWTASPRFAIEFVQNWYEEFRTVR